MTVNIRTTANSPLVSIVTPCYNGESHLEPYFAGLLLQNYPNKELIFVDDGSTDGTKKVFERFEPLLKAKFGQERITYIFQENKGVCSATNLGYKYSRGGYIVPCDSDDIMLPGKIDAHIDCFSRNPDAGAVYSDSYICEEKSLRILKRKFAYWKSPPSSAGVYDALLINGFFMGSASTYCFRKECLKFLPGGKLNEKYHGQNLELLLYISFHRKIVFHSDITVCIIKRVGSLEHQRQAKLKDTEPKESEITLDVIDKLGCSKETRRRMLKRHWSKVLRYHFFVTQDPKYVRRSMKNALKCGLIFDWKVWSLYLFHFIPWTWNKILEMRKKSD